MSKQFIDDLILDLEDNLKLNDIAEAESILVQIKLHLGTKHAETTNHLQKKINEAKRTQLLGTPTEHKERTEGMAQVNLDRLIMARQQLAETEEVGADTVHHLAQQRESLIKINQDVREVKSQLGVSNSLVNGMLRWWRG